LKDALNNHLREKILKALLDVAILARLEHKTMSGYEITKVFMKKFTAETSTSTVYSTLYAMERDGLVKGKYSRRSRVYELTEEGKTTLKNTRNKLHEIQAFIKTLIGN
jgi:DNA-binding PadR family transcriptional regulator